MTRGGVRGSAHASVVQMRCGYSEQKAVVPSQPLPSDS